MSFEGIVQRLNSRIGFHGEAFSQKALTRAVKKRMARLNLTDIARYEDVLSDDGSEMDWLVDQVVVHETWFFRDLEPFRYLRKYLSDLGRRDPKTPVRILSVPCSSGEEPYSIAMTVAGLTGVDGIRIDAVDVSRAALEKARTGRYGPNAFRETEMGPYWGYFREMGGDRQLSEDIIRMVQFHRGNILDYDDLNHNAPYQIIFCRNLLIYLDENARQLAVDHIDRLLADDGLLFLGYAESRQQFFPDYIAVRHPRAYACLKPGPHALSTAPQASPVVPAPRKIKREPRQAVDEPRLARPVLTAVRDPESVDEVNETDPMETAEQLADAGEIDQAARICKDILAEDPGRVAAYFLLGVVALAGGNEAEAEGCFTRALYLDPEHAASLNYMVLLMEKLGKSDKAELLRNRLNRIQERRSLGDERKTGSS